MVNPLTGVETNGSLVNGLAVGCRAGWLGDCGLLAGLAGWLGWLAGLASWLAELMPHLKRLLMLVLLGHEPGHETLIGSSGIQVGSGIHIKMHTNGHQGSGLHVKMHTNGP